MEWTSYRIKGKKINHYFIVMFDYFKRGMIRQIIGIQRRPVMVVAGGGDGGGNEG